MESTANQVKNKIEKSKRGKLFFPDDFAALGTPDAIRLALGKLHKSGLIMRVAHGSTPARFRNVKVGVDDVR